MHRLQVSRRLFVHGAGRKGQDAWPTVGSNGDFLSFPAESSIEMQAEQLIDEYSDDRLVIYAHSIGAVPTVLAAASGKLDVRGLILVEPALYDIARGNPAIERHISAVTEARAQAAAGNLDGFWAIFRPLMFGGGFDPDRWEAERSVADHWATTNIPWGHGIRTGMLTGFPTLVITGGWNDQYEMIARTMAEDSAQHVVLVGATHRPQDLPDFCPAVEEFERSL